MSAAVIAALRRICTPILSARTTAAAWQAFAGGFQAVSRIARIPEAAVDMKWKLWLRNLSVSAPRVAVRTQLPWTLRALLATAGLLLAAAAMGALYRHAQGGAPDQERMAAELVDLRQQLRDAVSEREGFAARAVQAENRLQVERAVQEQIAQQLKQLEEDNARLKGDLAFFESLLPTAAGANGVVIRSFKLQPDVDDETMRYRLLVQQSGRPVSDFVGAVTLRVSVKHADGTQAVLQVPDEVPAAKPLSLAFRHYQRVEGSFSLPPGALVRSVQVLISAGGTTRAQQTFAM
jgi:hypothetical protein